MVKTKKLLFLLVLFNSVCLAVTNNEKIKSVYNTSEVIPNHANIDYENQKIINGVMFYKIQKAIKSKSINIVAQYIKTGDMDVSHATIPIKVKNPNNNLIKEITLHFNIKNVFNKLSNNKLMVFLAWELTTASWNQYLLTLIDNSNVKSSNNQIKEIIESANKKVLIKYNYVCTMPV
jgi:hypothetical protein